MSGAVILWARLPISDLTGARLAAILAILTDRVIEIRGELAAPR